MEFTITTRMDNAASEHKEAETGAMSLVMADLLSACEEAAFAANHVDCVSAMQHCLPTILAAIAKAKKAVAR